MLFPGSCQAYIYLYNVLHMRYIIYRYLYMYICTIITYARCMRTKVTSPPSHPSSSFFSPPAVASLRTHPNRAVVEVVRYESPAKNGSKIATNHGLFAASKNSQNNASKWSLFLLAELMPPSSSTVGIPIKAPSLRMAPQLPTGALAVSTMQDEGGAADAWPSCGGKKPPGAFGCV